MIQASSLGQVQGQCLYPLIAEKHREAFKTLIRNVFQGKSGTLEFMFIGLKGHPGWLYSYIVPLRNDRGEIISALSLTIDITDRKKAEAEREQYYKFFQTSSDLMCMADPNGAFIKTNPAFSEVLGYSGAELVSKPFIEFIHPDDKQATLDEMAGQLQRGFTLNFENRYICKNGSERWLSWRAIYNKDEGITYATARDITDKKKSDQERERLNKELEQILYAASHDLKTPLVNINGYTGELKKSIEDILSLAENGAVPSEIRKKITSLTKELPEPFKFISSSVSRMDRLLNGLLQFSRSGSIDLKIDVIDMNALINEIADNLNYRMKDAGASLEVADLPGCIGDWEQINRIFSNLMENAVKYLDPVRKGEIKVTGHIKDNLSVYCVEDNGIGIAAEHQKQIFHIFHQLNPSISGEGLGLAIVQRIVERHGGKIWLESEKGKGCRFCVALPRKQ